MHMRLIEPGRLQFTDYGVMSWPCEEEPASIINPSYVVQSIHPVYRLFCHGERTKQEAQPTLWYPVQVSTSDTTHGRQKWACRATLQPDESQTARQPDGQPER